MTKRPAPGPAGPRVPCVDDEPDMLALVTRLLERMGLVASTAVSAGSRTSART